MGNWFRPNINFESISSYFWRNNLLLLLQRCERCRRTNYSELKPGGDDQEVLQEESASPSGPHKNWNRSKPNWTETNLCEAKEFSIKFSFRLSIIGANFSPGCGQRVSAPVLGVPSSRSRPRSTPVDGFQWRLIWLSLSGIQRVVRKLKQNVLRNRKTLLEQQKGNTLVPTQTHTLSSLSMNSICQQHLHLFLFLLRGAFAPQEVSDAFRLSPISRTLIVIWVACKLIPLIC